MAVGLGLRRGPMLWAIALPFVMALWCLNTVLMFSLNASAWHTYSGFLLIPYLAALAGSGLVGERALRGFPALRRSWWLALAALAVVATSAGIVALVEANAIVPNANQDTGLYETFDVLGQAAVLGPLEVGSIALVTWLQRRADRRRAARPDVSQM